MSAFLYVGDAARGADRVRDEYETKRLRNLQAFDSFRQMNPHATLEDLSAFADQLSGGSNWLRGRLPAESVMQSIATQNAENKRRDELRQAMVEEDYRQKTEAYMDTVLKKAAISTKDPVQALTYMRQNLPAMYQDRLNGLEQSGMFAQQFDTIRRDVAYDQARRAFELAASIPTLDPNAIEQFAEFNDLEPGLASLAKSVAKQKWATHVSEQSRAHMRELRDQIQFAASLGRDFGPDAFRAYGKDAGLSETAMSTMMPRFEEMRNEVYQAKINEAVGSITSNPIIVQGLATGGEAAMARVERIINDRAMQLPEALRDTFKVKAREELRTLGDFTEQALIDRQGQQMLTDIRENWDDLAKNARGAAQAAINETLVQNVLGTKNEGVVEATKYAAARLAVSEGVSAGQFTEALTRPDMKDVADMLKAGNGEGAANAFVQKLAGRPIRTETEARRALQSAATAGLPKSRLGTENEARQLIQTGAETTVNAKQIIGNALKARTYDEVRKAREVVTTAISDINTDIKALEALSMGGSMDANVQGALEGLKIMRAQLVGTMEVLVVPPEPARPLPTQPAVRSYVNPAVNELN